MISVEAGLVVITVSLLSFAFGYVHGKATMLKILDSHAAKGITLDEALKYEKAVMSGEIPPVV